MTRYSDIILNSPRNGRVTLSQDIEDDAYVSVFHNYEHIGFLTTDDILKAIYSRLLEKNSVEIYAEM